MIRLSDATILAYTKLRTRKIRTGITVAISGLLFGLLISVLMMFNGIERSVNSFSEEGLGKRYIVSAVDGSVFNQGFHNVTEDKDIIARAKVIQKLRIDEKVKEAKSLGIEYDADSENEVTSKYDDVEYLNPTSYGGQKALEEYYLANQPQDSLVTIKEKLAPYHPEKYFLANKVTPWNGELHTMKDGKEEFAKDEKQSGDGYASIGVNALTEAEDPIESDLTMMDGELTGPFILKNTKWQPSEGTIPIIVTYNSAEKFLGLKKLTSSATPKEKIARISEVREKAATITFDACYRNKESKELISYAIAVQKMVEKNKDKKDYQKPSLIYALPESDSCGSAMVMSDTRTADQKLYDEKQLIFDKKFEDYSDPYQAKIKFRVVGVSPGAVQASAGLMSDIASSLLNSSLGGSWVIPRDMYSKLPQSIRHGDILDQKPTENMDFGGYSFDTQYYAEFTNAKDAQAAMKQYSCISAECAQSGIFLTQFGSGSITIAEIKAALATATTVAALIIAGIATLIMAGTIGRMIADGRRETAVFRAIGANRGDISMIYLVYTFLLTLRVVLFGFILGALIALIVNYYVSPNATVGAQLMFGSSDLDRKFTLYGFASLEIMYIIGIIFVTGFISMILPLLRNIRRNPINDMRDE